MDTTVLIIVLIIDLIMSSGIVQCIDIHIIASSKDQCPSSPCLTLSQLSRVGYRNVTDITLRFEPGNHSLESELQVINATAFSMITNTASSDRNVSIVCHDNGRFVFIDVLNVNVSGLNFVGCIGNKLKSVDQFISEDSNFIGRKRSPIQSTYYYSRGSMLMVIQCTSVTFIRTSFEQNEFGTAQHLHYLYYESQLHSYNVQTRLVELGGAIYSEESKIEFVECIFEGNKAGLGGAVYMSKDSKITIIASSFVNNVANFFYQGIQLDPDTQLLKDHNNYWLRLVGSGGGAIYAHRTSLFIANTSFIHNIAQNGGAVRLYSFNGTITITGSNFTDNVAHDGGGAMWWMSINSIISIANNSFMKNVALMGENGGTLKLATTINTTATISGNIFNNNLAHNKSGGVISICDSNQSATTIISHNQFVNNHANKNGGVLSFLNNRYSLESADIILSENLFQNNSAHEDGGVIELKKANIKITKSNFTDNRADGNGGIFSLVESKLTIIESLFRFNTAGKDGGVIVSESSDISISDCDFIGNSVKKRGNGGVIKAYDTSLSFIGTLIVNNRADFGGVLSAHLSVFKLGSVNVFDNLAYTDGGVFHTKQTRMLIMGTTFIGNRAGGNGGIMHVDRDRISMIDCKFNRSIAGNDGGVMRSYLSEVNVSDSTFFNNEAENHGGVYHIELTDIAIRDQSLFKGNKADTGGVIWTDGGSLNIDQASFTNNMANTGGVIWTDAGTADINQASFTVNKANTAAVMWLDRATITSNLVNVSNNHANYTIIYSLESVIELLDTLLSSNVGSLCAIESTIRLADVVMTKMQAVNQSSANQLEEGGAITAFQSEVTFKGISSLKYNRASTGGTLHATEAKLYIYGTVTIANNTALQNGGGIYLYQSELTCQRKSMLKLLGNIAMEKGGGIHAVGSLIKVKVPVAKSLKYSMLNFMINKADKGGGIFLEMDSKVYILKSIATNLTEKHDIINFTGNYANYGGAVYVSDDGMCALSVSNKECFLQALALYGSTQLIDFNNCKTIHFERNRAIVSGHSLYGGLLDRCKISPLAELRFNNISERSNRTVTVGGLSYLASISNIKNLDIASPPVRVCFCRNGQPDCSYNPAPVPIRRDQLTEIPISLAALDQLKRPIGSTIYNRLSSGDDLCQHHIQTNDENCSIINFTASLNLNESQKEELILLTGGPCKEISDSQVRLTFNVYCPKCPIGFKLLKNEEGCRCGCDERLLPFISNCQLSSKALVRDRNIWIAFMNTTDDSNGYQYLVHPFCPLDYCQPSSSQVEVNLNLPNGSDAQCANGRSGLLCGTCQSGLSLSLGSSHCIHCPSHWPVNLVAIIIAALLAGILLVVLVLLLNLTVAVGTLNAIVFYANIIATRNSTFLRFSSPNFVTVFISWLNLEAGFDACFFEGMDAFWKSLLQLAFPAYIITLVIVIIITSEYSNKFANIIGKRNPVATLATLILLSYTILLNSVITSLSYAILNYPDGSQQTVWLADASVNYLSGKHMGLLITAAIVLIAGIFYTTILFSWQWLLRHQNFYFLKWIKSPKLCHFIEPYHAPYTFKHRYWTGLLLLSRVLLHLVSAINTTGDPQLTILAISLITGCLLLIKGMVATKVYKNRLIDLIETLIYFNVLAFAALTWYTLDAGKSQTAVAYISVMITFVLFLVVVVAHVYQYTNLFAIFKSTWLFQQTLAKLQGVKRQAKTSGRSKSSALESKSMEDCEENSEPTYTVIEVHDRRVYSGNYTIDVNQ